jgi:magnesium-transporting ATPase (P-type)
MPYAGTAVAHGRGSAVVVETGMRTEFKAIARLLQISDTNELPAPIRRPGRGHHRRHDEGDLRRRLHHGASHRGITLDQEELCELVGVAAHTR